MYQCRWQFINVILYTLCVPPFINRYLVWLEAHLTNLEQTHPGAMDLLTKGAIAVARSIMPGALSAVDKTMEETFMRFAKSAGKN